MVCIKLLLKANKKKYEAEVTIEDSDTLVGVAGFIVSTAGLTGTTDVNGVVTLGPFPKGTYTLTATHPDYEDIEDTFTAPEV
jgi:hypothetical protein